MIKSALQSSLTNDIKYRSMSAGAVPSSEYLITSIVLTQNEPSVTFSNLSQYAGTYKHLTMTWSVRSARANTGDLIRMEFNNDATNANYAYHWLAGTGSTVNSGGESLYPYVTYITAGSDPAGFFSAVSADILDPFNTSKYTTTRLLHSGAYDRQIVLSSLLWENTAAVDSIKIYAGNGDLAQYSRFSLYGVTA